MRAAERPIPSPVRRGHGGASAAPRVARRRARRRPGRSLFDSTTMRRARGPNARRDPRLRFHVRRRGRSTRRRYQPTRAAAPGAVDAEPLDGVRDSRIPAESSEAEREAGDRHRLVDDVARRSGLGAHDRAVLAQQRVEQRRFSRVGGPARARRRAARPSRGRAARAARAPRGARGPRPPPRRGRRATRALERADRAAQPPSSACRKNSAWRSANAASRASPRLGDDGSPASMPARRSPGQRSCSASGAARRPRSSGRDAVADARAPVGRDVGLPSAADVRGCGRRRRRATASPSSRSPTRTWPGPSGRRRAGPEDPREERRHAARRAGGTPRGRPPLAR